MGAPMAGHLLAAGHAMTIHTRTRSKANHLAARGATLVESAAEATRHAEVVFVCVTDTPDVKEVLLGEKGVIKSAKKGLIVVDHSTISPAATREMAQALHQKGATLLDAPISGGDVGARNGTLTIMVGGPQDAFDRTVPLFQAMGKAYVLVGDSGAGQIAKVCNQIIVGAQMVALAEALITAQKAGVDPARVVDAIKGGAAQMWTLDVKPPRLFAGNRNPGFKAYMQHKDHGIIVDTAKTYGIPVPMSALVMQLYTAMLEQGNRELDNSAIISVYESLTGIKLVEPLKDQK